MTALSRRERRARQRKVRAVSRAMAKQQRDGDHWWREYTQHRDNEETSR